MEKKLQSKQNHECTNKTTSVPNSQMDTQQQALALCVCVYIRSCMYCTCINAYMWSKHAVFLFCCVRSHPCMCHRCSLRVVSIAL